MIHPGYSQICTVVNVNVNSLAAKPQVSIELLPALPDNWKDGSVSGIRARGGITIDMTWRDKSVTTLTLTAQRACKVTLLMNGESSVVKLKKGKNVLISS